MTTTTVTADQLAEAIYNVERPNPMPATWSNASDSWREHVTTTAELVLLRTKRGLDLDLALAQSWHSRHNPMPQTWAETTDSWREVARGVTARVLAHATSKEN